MESWSLASTIICSCENLEFCWFCVCYTCAHIMPMMETLNHSSPSIWLSQLKKIDWLIPSSHFSRIHEYDNRTSTFCLGGQKETTTPLHYLALKGIRLCLWNQWMGGGVRLSHNYASLQDMSVRIVNNLRGHP